MEQNQNLPKIELDQEQALDEIFQHLNGLYEKIPLIMDKEVGEFTTTEYGEYLNLSTRAALTRLTVLLRFGHVTRRKVRGNTWVWKLIEKED